MISRARRFVRRLSAAEKEKLGCFLIVTMTDSRISPQWRRVPYQDQTNQKIFDLDVLMSALIKRHPNNLDNGINFLGRPRNTTATRIT